MSNVVKQILLLAVLGSWLMACAPAEVAGPVVLDEQESAAESLAAVADEAEEMVEEDLVGESPFAALSAEAQTDALFKAAREDDNEAALALIALEADINAAELAVGLTPLSLAVIRGNVALAEALISAGADASIVDHAGNNLLHHAVDENDPTLVALILEQDGLDVDLARDQYGSTPLIMAARQNNMEIAGMLLAEGADLEKGDDWNDTPFNIAAYFGHMEMLTYLQEQGATVKVVNTLDKSALTHAQDQGRAEAEAFLLALPEFSEPAVEMSQSELNNELFKALRKDDITAVVSWLDQGADVNAVQGGINTTPLIVATLRNNVEMLELLLDAGADLTLIDPGGNNLLNHAATSESLEAAEFLLTFSELDIENRRRRWEFTPLLTAAFQGDVAMVELLVAHGADLEGKDKWGDTALNGAAWNGKLEAVKALVALGAEVDVENQEGANALGHAVSQNRTEVELYLLTVME